MNTPICDFIDGYILENGTRMHMPGHKGVGELEALDITEIEGVDSLYSDTGIIRESENNATELFGSLKTCYSTQGSTQCIKAMLHLAKIYQNPKGRGYILAGRNAHSSLISAAFLLDFDIKWLYPKKSESYVSCTVKPSSLDTRLKNLKNKPFAVYVTSPDYLGNVADIKGLSDVCKKHGVLLLVDNAHGAYLKLCGASEHPIDLGADLCCDSAHKTLPALTGAAYLHISKSIPNDARELMLSSVKTVMALYGSTSPSFLTLRSLDKLNALIASGKIESEQKRVISGLSRLKKRLNVCGFKLFGKEKLKLTIYAPSYGYTGTELNALLKEKGITVEFFDNDFVVFMLSSCTTDSDIYALESALTSIPKKPALSQAIPTACKLKTALSIRETIFAPKERVKVENALGRVLASFCISCPPAVSIAACGEIISEDAIKLFKYYGTEFVEVVK